MPTDQAIAAQAELERRRRRQSRRVELPENWPGWLRTLLPTYFPGEFGPHHARFWSWAWSIERGVRPRPYIGAWSRGGGKTTGGEAACVALGLRGKRRYALYVRGTQDAADRSVENIGSMLESWRVQDHYPDHARRGTGLYGRSKGWRRNRLYTDGGFVVDAIGLDTAMRGIKVEERRPDVIIFDDLDAKHDSQKITQKKIETLTTSLLPAGTPDCAVMGLQNLIIPDGIFSQMYDNRAEFLIDRIFDGPIPAVLNLEIERRPDEETGRVFTEIVGGQPTWSGQGLDECQQFINTFGLSAFLLECQHDVFEREGALWNRGMIRHVEALQDQLVRVVIGVDPSGGAAEIGIVAAGKYKNGRGCILADETQPGRLGSLNWGRKAVNLYDLFEADRIVGEANFGGDMVASNIQVAAPERRVPVKLVSASRGKRQRAEPVASLYSDGMVDHVGVFPELEREQVTWVPDVDDWSPNRIDAAVWALHELFLARKPRRRKMLNGRVG